MTSGVEAHKHHHNGMEDCEEYNSCIEGCHCHLQDESHTACCKGAMARSMYAARRAQTSTNASEPPPVPNEGTPIFDLVIADMEERKRIGIEKYGTPLQAGNGRDAIVDLYQELLDAVVYLRQFIEERRRAVEVWDLNGAPLTRRDVEDLFCLLGIGGGRD